MSEEKVIKEEFPNISLVTILHDWEQFYPLFKHHWNTLDYPKDKIEWIFIDDSKTDHSDIVYSIDSENILYLRVFGDEYLEKIEFPKDDDKITWNYFKKTNTLPNGFKRDYAVGMCSHEYIFHLDFDCIYQPKVLKRKLKFLRTNRLGCVYCKNMLCHDIYGKKLYKVEGNFGYESTLLHTKEFWKQSGFKWEDLRMEAVAFYHNKGSERKMDNYYDTIKILSVHNANDYRPKEVTLENMDIKIPEIVNTLNIDIHPIQVSLNDVFKGNSINVLGLDSMILDHIKRENWNMNNIFIEKKKKEKSIIKDIKELKKDFNLCIINVKFPIWKVFDSVKFNIVLFESDKNIEQMDSILKSKNYLNFNGLYFHKDYLLN